MSGGLRIFKINYDKEGGIKRSVPFNFFTSQKAYRLGSLNQLFGLIYSFFIPTARTYILTSSGCMITVVLKKKIFKSKVISLNSDTFFRDLAKAKWFRRRYQLWLIKHIDGMISTSYMMKRLASKFIDVPHEVVYPFCDIKKFSRIKPNYSNVNICSIGTGIATKGIDILYEAFEIYNTSFPKSKLYVCGYKDYISHLKKQNNTVLTGFADPVVYLAKSGFYINTSRHESFGVNIIEAMCAGLPTLVTNRCGAVETVRKIDPWLVTSLDPKEIARKAIALQKNTKKKRLFGRKGKKIAKAFTKEKSVREFKKAFSRMLQQIK